MLNKLTDTINSWLKALEEYHFSILLIKPSAQSWSLGQLYIHLIDDTNYYIEQAKTALQSDDNSTGEMSPGAKKIFLNDGFPDIIIAGEPGNDPVPQPAGKEQLINGLLDLRQAINAVNTLMLQSPFKGKTKHPGLGYFNAEEWMQFAEMHFRHHIRQKKRIDDFLAE